MPLDLPLLRQLLTAIEAKPTTLGAFEASQGKDRRKDIRALAGLAEKARLFEYRRGAFSINLQLTTAGQELLALLHDEGAFGRVKQQLDAETSVIDLRELKGRLAASKAAATPPVPAPSPQAPAVHRPKIFLVHGHDKDTREQVTLFLERMGLDVLALDEQHNAGKTVIEKFEDNVDVNFAVVLLTEDDLGGKTREDLRPRPRQNVIFELGYFMGRLRRDRVCALRSGNVELPSDIGGMVWLSFDGRWKRDLANELEKAGYTIDWKKLVD
jgi:predicted nucleotide-binding protein